MQYRTHNQKRVPTSGTCLRGYCPEGTTYALLVALFGEPQGGCGKTDWEWSIEFEDGTIATIYNWKDGPGYGGAGPDARRTWHIGGYYQEPQGLAVEHVLEVLAEAQGLVLANEELRRLWRLSDEGNANAAWHLDHFGGGRNE